MSTFLVPFFPEKNSNSGGITGKSYFLWDFVPSLDNKKKDPLCLTIVSHTCDPVIMVNFASKGSRCCSDAKPLEKGFPEFSDW